MAIAFCSPQSLKWGMPSTALGGSARCYQQTRPTLLRAQAFWSQPVSGTRLASSFHPQRPRVSTRAFPVGGIRAAPRPACERSTRRVVRMQQFADAGNHSLAAPGPQEFDQDIAPASQESSSKEVRDAQLVSLNGVLQGALMAALLQGIVDPAAILAACVLGLTITMVDARDLRSLINKASSLVTSRTPSQQELQSIISNLERLLQESRAGSDPAVAARHKAELAAAMSVLLQSSSPALPGSDTTNKRITRIIHQVLEQLGNALTSVEGSLSGDQLQTSLAPVIAAAAARFQPVTASLTSGASQIPSIPSLLRYVVSTLPQVGTPSVEEVPSLSGRAVGQMVAEWESLLLPRQRKAAIFVPLALSAQLSTSQPIKVKVYDQSYVMWRPREGEVAALPEACPHRGASLAMGSLVGTAKEGKCVKCPYHGLEFNAKGSCDKRNIFTDTINVVEANGVVWMKDAPLAPTDLLDFDEDTDEVDLAPFLRTFHEALGAPMAQQTFLDAYSGQESEGSAEPETEGDVAPFDEHFGLAGFRSMAGFVDIAAAPKAVVDNTFDLHHMTYVHKTTFGGGELIRTWKPNETTICFEYGMSRTNPFTSFFGDGRVLVKMERAPPYSAMVTVGDSAGRTVMKTLTHVVPVAEDKSRLIWQLLRNFGTLPILDPVFKYSVQRILSEDQAVLEGVNLNGVREGMDLGI